MRTTGKGERRGLSVSAMHNPGGDDFVCRAYQLGARGNAANESAFERPPSLGAANRHFRHHGELIYDFR
jgi:hypothetical protein